MLQFQRFGLENSIQNSCEQRSQKAKFFKQVLFPLTLFNDKVACQDSEDLPPALDRNQVG